MKEVRQKIGKLLRIPTSIELSLLYFLVGFFVATATNAVVSLAYIDLVSFLFLIVCILLLLRFVSLFLALSTRTFTKHLSRWIQLVSIATMMVIIFGTNFDLSIRVKLSERALYKEIDKLLTLPPESQKSFIRMGPLSYGLFNVTIHEIDSQNGIIWFYTGDGGTLFPPPFSLYGGIVYCKQGQPPERPEATYQHLYGPWWRWIQDG